MSQDREQQVEGKQDRRYNPETAFFWLDCAGGRAGNVPILVPWRGEAGRWASIRTGAPRFQSRLWFPPGRMSLSGPIDLAHPSSWWRFTLWHYKKQVPVLISWDGSKSRRVPACLRAWSLDRQVRVRLPGGQLPGLDAGSRQPSAYPASIRPGLALCWATLACCCLVWRSL